MKLTISELLKKHYPTPHAYGTINQFAAKHEVTTKQFMRWFSGATTPSGDQALLLLQRLNELKNYPPQV